jgi:hypothetical protein
MHITTENTPQELEGPLDSVAMPKRTGIDFWEAPGEKVLWYEQPEPLKFLDYFLNDNLNLLKWIMLASIILSVMAARAISNWSVYMLLGAAVFYFWRMIRWNLTFKRTHYIITNQRIVFVTWRWATGTTVREMKYNDLTDVQLIWYNETSKRLWREVQTTRWNHIVLLTGKDVGFWTYDLLTEERRFHPTLERLKHAEKAFEKIQHQKNAQINSQRPKTIE